MRYILSLLTFFSILSSTHVLQSDEAGAPPPAPQTDLTTRKIIPKEAYQDWKNETKVEEEKPTEGQHIDKLWSKTFGLLLFIFVALFIVTWLLKRYQHGKFFRQQESGYVQVIERRMLSPKACVWLLKIYDKEIAVIESTQTCEVIATFDSKEE